MFVKFTIINTHTAGHPAGKVDMLAGRHLAEQDMAKLLALRMADLLRHANIFKLT